MVGPGGDSGVHGWHQLVGEVVMARWRRGGRRRKFVDTSWWPPREKREVAGDGETAAVPVWSGTGCSDELAASAELASCAPELLEAEDEASRATAGGSSD